MEEYKAALNFLKTLLTEQRLLSKKRNRIAEDIAVWGKRITLAGEKGETNLKISAEEMKRELEKEKMGLDVEAKELEREIRGAKEDLSRLEVKKDIHLDPAQLLEKIEKLTGEKAEALLLEEELEKLKKEPGD